MKVVSWLAAVGFEVLAFQPGRHPSLQNATRKVWTRIGQPTRGSVDDRKRCCHCFEQGC